MTPKEKALEIIRVGYYGGEMTAEELVYALDEAIRNINECKHESEGSK